MRLPTGAAILLLLVIVQLANADDSWWSRNDDDDDEDNRKTSISRYACYGKCSRDECCAKQKSRSFRYTRYRCQSKAKKGEKCGVTRSGFSDSCNECAPGLECKRNRCREPVTKPPATQRTTPAARPTTQPSATLAKTSNKCSKACRGGQCCAKKVGKQLERTGSAIRDNLRKFLLSAIFVDYQCAPKSSEGQECDHTVNEFLEFCGCDAGLICGSKGVCVKPPTTTTQAPTTTTQTPTTTTQAPTTTEMPPTATEGFSTTKLIETVTHELPTTTGKMPPARSTRIPATSTQGVTVKQAKQTNKCEKPCNAKQCCARRIYTRPSKTGSAIKDSIREFWNLLTFKPYQCAAGSSQGEACDKLQSGFSEYCGCRAGLICGQSGVCSAPTTKPTKEPTETTTNAVSMTTTDAVSMTTTDAVSITTTDAGSATTDAVAETTDNVSMTTTVDAISTTTAVFPTTQDLTTTNQACPESQTLMEFCQEMRDAMALITLPAVEKVFHRHCDQSGLVPNLWTH